MRKVKYSLAILSSMLILACAINPLTGKKQVAITDERTVLIPAAYQQYSNFLKENKIINNTADAKMVSKVGDKIKNAAISYMKSKGLESYIADYQWEYRLIDNPELNAWCMPGGKIAVFSGILKVAQNEAGLATVMGHEVAHALLSHSRQRVDAAMAKQLLGQVIGAAVSDKSQQTQQAVAAVYNLGSSYGVMLPFSRSHESEADHLGLILMNMAGYDMNEAVRFWDRMNKESSGESIEFLSTHPSNETRINDIKKLIPTIQ